MANNENKGNQIQRISYQQPITARSENQAFYQVLPTGIAQGGEVSFNATNIIIQPLTAFIDDPTATPTGVALRVETTEAYSIVRSGLPEEADLHVVLNYEWLDSANNFMDIVVKRDSELLSQDIIVWSFDNTSGSISNDTYQNRQNNPLTLLSATSNEDNSENYLVFNQGKIKSVGATGFQIIDDVPSSVTGPVFSLVKNYNNSLSNDEVISTFNLAQGGDGTIYNQIVTSKGSSGNASILEFKKINYDGSDSFETFMVVDESGIVKVDYINERSTDNGVVIEDVNIKDGEISMSSLPTGVASTINTLIDNKLSTWTQLTVPSGTLYGITFAESLGRFVAVGRGSTNNIQYSDDGINWTQLTVPNGGLDGVTFSESLGRFVAVGTNTSNNIQYSDDGITWTQLTVPNGNLYEVTFSESLGRFVAVGSNTTNNIQYSSDGITWTQLTVPNGILSGVTFSESLGRFVAVGSESTNNIQYSDDGINWTQLTVPNGTLRDVTFSESLGRFVAVGSNTTNNIQYSDDGITWTQLTVPNGTLFGVTFSESLGRFVAVGSRFTNNIQYSSDGITWTQSTVSANGSIRDVTFSESLGRFVAVGSIATNNIQYC